MAERQTRVIGSDTQNIETMSAVTGVQRVVREAHVAMTDVLSERGYRVVPLHTRDEPRRREFRSNAYLSTDPVIDQVPVGPDDVDAYVFLDLNANADYARVHRAKRSRPRPVITLVHDVLPIIHPEWCVDDPGNFFRIYLQQVLAVSDHVILTTDKVRQDVLSFGWRVRGDLHVIGLGSTFRQRTPEPPPDDRMSLLFVSTIEPRKGHDILLDAFDILRSQGRDVDLTLVGRVGWLCDDVVARIQSHPDLGGRLRWHRFADDLTVATLARECTIGVFPAADEGFGLFLEEGLSYGLKMVVSDIPVLRERAQPNVSFSARDGEAFAHAIEQAHAAPWRAGHRVRTMSDFGYDVADLVDTAVRNALPT